MLFVMMFCRIPSVSARTEVALRGFARAPLATGDQGITLKMLVRTLEEVESGRDVEIEKEKLGRDGREGRKRYDNHGIRMYHMAR